MIPNAITALALCMGLTGVSLAIRGEWANALGSIVLAGVLDGFDGRIARLLRAQSKFGAELDSLSDNIAFGTAPALILFLWSLQHAPRFGWIAALALAVCCALRLARFNSRIDATEQPHKSAGFNTGVPAPAGAGLAFVPIFLWLITDNELFRRWELVMPWTRSEEHTSELQSRQYLVCRLLLEKKKNSRNASILTSSLSFPRLISPATSFISSVLRSHVTPRYSSMAAPPTRRSPRRRPSLSDQL